MNPLFGEYDCKVDAKGRFLLPAGLLRQMDGPDAEEFVIKQGPDGNLEMYPTRVFQDELMRIAQKNRHQANTRRFLRAFQQGAKRVSPDGNKRLLIPKPLLDTADIDKDIVLIAAIDRVEIWDKAKYEQWLDDEANDLAQLSEDVMGDTDNG